ncbi:MAG: glycosyltransferase family 2 protein, partial [Nitrospira sp.]|nr:glycosyltransferase family 2 protein [Nitrospira sp.]
MLPIDAHKEFRLVARISVVIPAYNGTSRYLTEAIDSVRRQTLPASEIIVVDDASTDGTDALVQAIPQIRYVRHPQNSGQAAARNTGARLAQGPYVAFLDQDDLWEPTFLEETLALLQPAAEAVLVHCDGYQVNERNEILEYDAAMKQQRSITQLLRGGHDAATSGSLFRKTCFDAVGGYDA